MNNNSNNISINNFFADEIENLEIFIIDERNKNQNLNEVNKNLGNRLNYLRKQFQIKINDEIYKNKNLLNKIENLEIDLINTTNTKRDLIESNKKINEKFKNTKKELDDLIELNNKINN